MTEYERNKIRIAACVLSEIGDMMHGGRDIKTGIRDCVEDLQKKDFIPGGLTLTENGDLMKIDMPKQFCLEFDTQKRMITIQFVPRVVSEKMSENDVRALRWRKSW